MSIEKTNRIESEPKKSNVLVGIDLTKEVAAKHEKELRELIEQNEGANIVELIKEGAITAEQLVAEFEELARERGIDLNDFYEKAGRHAFHGHRFEFTTFIQIMRFYFAKKAEKGR